MREVICGIKNGNLKNLFIEISKMNSTELNNCYEEFNRLERIDPGNWRFHNECRK